METDRPEELLRMTAEAEGGNTIIRLTGELDYTTAGLFREQVDRLQDAELRRITLDLSALTFCDSVGIACLLAVWKRARKAGGDLVLLRPTGHVQRMLRITNLDRSITVVDTPSDSDLPGAQPT
jgi:anti-sigma B factor antagonist